VFDRRPLYGIVLAAPIEHTGAGRDAHIDVGVTFKKTVHRGITSARQTTVQR
jgi:hypothetical protein